MNAETEPAAEKYIQQERKLAVLLRQPLEEGFEHLATSPDAAWVAYATGELLGLMGDYEGAMRSFFRALDQDAASPLAQAPLFAFLARGKRLDRLSRLVEEWPDLARPRQYLAGVLWRGGDKEEALRQYERAVALNPEDPSGWTRIAQLGARLHAPDKLDLAVERASQLAPRSYVHQIRLVEALATAGRIRQAHRVARSAAKTIGSNRARMLPWIFPYFRLSKNARVAIGIGLLVLWCLLGYAVVTNAVSWWVRGPLEVFGLGAVTWLWVGSWVDEELNQGKSLRTWKRVRPGLLEEFLRRELV